MAFPETHTLFHDTTKPSHTKPATVGLLTEHLEDGFPGLGGGDDGRLALLVVRAALGGGERQADHDVHDGDEQHGHEEEGEGGELEQVLGVAPPLGRDVAQQGFLQVLQVLTHVLYATRGGVFSRVFARGSGVSIAAASGPI